MEVDIVETIVHCEIMLLNAYPLFFDQTDSGLNS